MHSKFETFKTLDLKEIKLMAALPLPLPSPQKKHPL